MGDGKKYNLVFAACFLLNQFPFYIIQTFTLKIFVTKANLLKVRGFFSHKFSPRL